MRTRRVLCAVAAAIAGGLWALPSIDPATVTMTQDALSRKVTVTYRLADESAIVTLDIETNATGTVEGPWVALGDKVVVGAMGDVNRRIEPGDVTRTIYWQPSVGGVVFSSVQARAVVKAWRLSDPPDYLSIDLLPPYGAEYFTCAEQLPWPVTHEIWKTTRVLMKRMHAAGLVWRKGSLTNSRNLPAVSLTPHYVQLTDDYYLGVFPFTQRQLKLSMKSDFAFNAVNDSQPANAKPAWGVNWKQLRGDLATYNFPAKGYEVSNDSLLAAFRARYGALGVFDLPSDAQWEFAARAGHYMWEHSLCQSMDGDYASVEYGEVGLHRANDYGLYDMERNISQWVLDIYPQNDDLQRDDGTVYVDPHGPAFYSGCGPIQRSLMGYWPVYARDAFNADPSDYRAYCGYGFRLACNFLAMPPAAE